MRGNDFFEINLMCNAAPLTIVTQKESFLVLDTNLIFSPVLKKIPPE